MFFVSKKKYDALKNEYEALMKHCIFQKDAFDRLSNLASSVVDTNGRIIEHWNDCIKERNRLYDELHAIKEESCQDDQQKLDLP